jgi:hypothetical protein
MIDAAKLPAVRARAEGAVPAENETRSTTTSDAAVAPPSYPSKKLVLENGRYLVAGTTK